MEHTEVGLFLFVFQIVIMKSVSTNIFKVQIKSNDERGARGVEEAVRRGHD